MKKYSISVLLIWFLLLCDTVPVLADDPCEDPTKQLQAFVSSLNSKIKAGAGKGLFEVKPIEQEGMVTRWSVTYRLSGRTVFLQDVTPPHDQLTLSANMFSGQSSLIFKYSFGAGGHLGCGYAVFPQEGRFTYLKIPYPLFIEDLDRDNNLELLVLEKEQWAYIKCNLSTADHPYWPRIFRLDLKNGKLIDISKQFPQVYIDKYKDYQARYVELKEEKFLSPECSMHYSQFLERLKQSSIKTNVEWETLNKEVEDLYNAGQYDRAVDVAKKALELAEKNVGSDHPDVAESLSNLARLYFAKGQYAQAEPLARRALAICEKALGPDHSDVAASLTNLAAIYRKQGQYAQAEPLARRALAIREKTLSPDHPDVAESMANLAAIYYLQKQYSQAELLYKRALEIWEKTLGSDHPTAVTARKNMAALYPVTNPEQEAEKLEQPAERIGAGENEDKVRTFDITGIRLGMSLNDVKQVFPQFNVPALKKDILDKRWSEVKKTTLYIKRYEGCGRTGSAETDANVCVDITDDPYGSGAYFISYNKYFPHYATVDPSAFVDNFRNQLMAKYGKPTYEDRIQKKNTGTPFGEIYFACWGRSCTKDMRNFRLHDEDGPFSPIYNNKIQDGSYLIASFNHDQVQEARLTLFDTNPYSVKIREAIREESRKKLKEAQEKLGF